MNNTDYIIRRKELLKRMEKLVLKRIDINLGIKKTQKEMKALDRALMLE